MANIPFLNNAYFTSKVGIGIPNPGYALEVNTTSNGYSLVSTFPSGPSVGIYNGTNGGQGIGTVNNYPIHIFTNNSAPQMTISTSGDVGIGITVPSSRLTVVGSTSTNIVASKISLNGAQSWGNVLMLATTAGTDNARLLFSSRNFAKQWSTGAHGLANDNGYSISEDGGDVNSGSGFGSARLYIKAGGNVGIGTTSPDAKLEITTLREPGIRLSSSDTTANPNELLSAIEFYSADVTSPGVKASIQAKYTDAAANTYLSFETGMTGANTEAMRIDSVGNVLIGATSLADVSNLSTNHLFVGSSSSPGTAGIGVYNNTGTASVPVLNILQRDTSTDSSNRFIQFYANVVANTSSTPMGGIVGNGAGNVQFASLSDIREKENINTISGSLDKINSLNPVEFDWIKSEEHCNAGFVAQEVEKIFPEFVMDNISNDSEEERKGLTGGMTGGIIPHLVKAIQELTAKVEILEQKI